jgi:site-specific recombinase XerD
MNESIGVTWREMEKLFLSRKKNKNTRALYESSLDSYRKHIKTYDKKIHPLNASYRELRNVIEDWVFMNTATMKASSARTRLTGVSAFYSFLIDEEYIDLVRNPASRISVWEDEPPKALEHPSEELANRFEACLRQDAAGGDIRHVRNWLMLRVLMESGVRCAELLDLCPESIMESAKIRVSRGKGNKVRNTAVLPETARLLTQFAADCKLKPRERLFMPAYKYKWMPYERTKVLRKTGEARAEHMTSYGTRLMLKTAAERHGFDEKEVKLLQRPHGYRHLWAVRHVKAGTNHIYIMLMAGWKNMDMLEYYISYASFDIKAVEKSS